MQDIRVTGAFDVTSLHSSFVLAQDEGVAVIDLTDAGFITPAGSLTAATFAHRAARMGREIRLVRPANDRIANYAARSHLGQAIEELGGTHDLPSIREHDVGNNLLTVTAFDDDRGVEQLARHVWESTHERDEDAASVIFTALAAIGENVGRHSGQRRGYIAAQNTHGGSILRFAVADSGQGFRKSLVGHSPPSDVDALLLAVKPGISGTEDTRRGWGLSDLVHQMRKVGGTLWLRSGKGGLTEFPNGRSLTSSSRNRLRGSILEGELRIARP